MEKVVVKENRSKAKHICNPPRDFDAEDKKMAEKLVI